MGSKENLFTPQKEKVVAIVKIETAVIPNEPEQITKALTGNVAANPISPQDTEQICQIIAEEIGRLMLPNQELDAIIIVRLLPKKTATTK